MPILFSTLPSFLLVFYFCFVCTTRIIPFIALLPLACQKASAQTDAHGSMHLLSVDAQLATGTATPSYTFPEYARGKDYKWVLNTTERDNGITYLGAHGRLRAAISRFQNGSPLKITTIGGSITAGQGCVDAPNWPTYLLNFLTDQYGDKVVGHNGAVGGTVSGYMSVCHNMHVPKDTDIVFVEYSVNDWHSIQPYYENGLRRSFERLLRKLFKYPNKPAVVFMHAYIWFEAQPHKGAFWANTEREFNEFALYYNIPSLSVKAAAYQRMLTGSPGFNVTAPRNTDRNGLKDIAFYYDPIHPDGRTGSRVMGELAMHLIQNVYEEVKRKPATPDDDGWVLPVPMVAHNYESISDKCFIGSHFTATVQTKEGFEWINEAKGNRPKWGFVAKTAGSVLKMLIDTRATASGTDGAGAAGQAASTAEVLVELAYLKSYEHMGSAKVTCESGCTCAESKMEGHTTQRNSQLFLHNFFASQHEQCVVVVTVLPETASGEHKFKLAGLMISEESGQKDGIRNNAAVEYVGDISQRSKDGTFNANNHAR